MLRKLVVLSAVAIGSLTLARADTITGFLSATNGTDIFTSSTIQWEPGTTVGGTVGGTFASYLTDGNAVNFLPGSLPYLPGFNVAPPLPAIFTVSNTAATETFSFFLVSYDAMYGTSSVPGCVSGDTCLLITGNGYFTGSGLVSYSASPATFQFDTSYVPGQTVGVTITSFAAQASATGATPEPASLALLGTGMLGVVGLARRRFGQHS